MTDANSTPAHKKKIALHNKIFIGLLVGLVTGLICNFFWPNTPELKLIIENLTGPLGKVFLNIIFMAVIPLIFSALALGVAELGDIRQLGRIGAKTLAMTLLLTSISVLIGLTLVNTVRPGRGLSQANQEKLLAYITSKAAGDDSLQADIIARPGSALSDSTEVEKVKKALLHASKSKSISETLQDLIPKNPLEDAARAFDPEYEGGGILALMVFSLFVGIALALTKSERTQAFEHWLQGLYDIVMKIIQIGMKLAPLGVACLVFGSVAQLGMDIVVILGKYIAVVMIGLLLHMFVVYSLLLKYVIRISPWTFFQRIKVVILTAFSTSSSNVTLPTTLRVTEENLGVPRKISNFVLTLGSTANQNGTALYEGVTVLFLAQLFGQNLTMAQQITVVLAAVLAGIGTAGVPGGSLPVVVLVLQSVGIPGYAIGVIIGVDRILDMSRTVLNVTGDITAAMWVAKSEGHELKLR